MAWGKRLPSLAGVGLLVATATALAGEFPASNIRAYCDSKPPPDTYWGAREIRGDINDVDAGFNEGGGQFGVYVINQGTDRDGVPFDSVTSCNRAIDSWRFFEASLGQKGDSLRLDGTPEPDPSGPLPARITAEAAMGPGADVARGHVGKDRFEGGAGGDRLLGFGGNDRLTGGAGRDILKGGRGRDVLIAADGARDKVNCGPGRDKAIVDGKDDVNANCEIVKTV